MRVRVVDTIEGFRSLADEWESLLERSAQADPYLTFDWLEAWWSVYAGDDDRLYVLAFFEDGSDSLAGALPAFVEHSKRVVTLRRLRLLSDHMLAPHRTGCVADPRNADQVYELAAEHLSGDLGAWDVLDLRRMDASSPFLDHLARRFEGWRGGSASDVSELGPVAFEDSWEEYSAGLSSGMRRSLKRKKAKLERVGELELETIPNPEVLPGALADATRMFEASMKRKYERAYAVSERFVDFHALMTERFLARDRLRLSFLRVGGERVAFVLDFLHQGMLFSYRTGFHDAWGSYSVGTLVHALQIERAIGEGATGYDFGPGGGQHKTQWGAEPGRDLAHFRVYNRTAAASWSRLAEATDGWLRRTARRVLPESVSNRVASMVTRVASWRALQRR